MTILSFFNDDASVNQFVALNFALREKNNNIVTFALKRLRNNKIVLKTFFCQRSHNQNPRGLRRNLTNEFQRNCFSMVFFFGVGGISCTEIRQEQCFSTFICSRHPSFHIEQFGGTPCYKLPVNKPLVHYLATPLEFFTAPVGSTAPRLRTTGLEI